jgi:hypothetical protein
VKVDHLPSSPSKFPLGLRTTGFNGDGRGVVSALFWKNIVSLDTATTGVDLDPACHAQHEFRSRTVLEDFRRRR